MRTAPPRLPRAFFARAPPEVARDLLGRRLVRREGGRRLAGSVVEAEAYGGPDDLASHARAGRTARNAPLWGPPGHAYVYLVYGVHRLLNVVVGRDGEAGGVLVRALVPGEGLEVMRRRRPGRPDSDLLRGPANLCRALGVDGALDGHDLCTGRSLLFLEPGEPVPDDRVEAGPRVGLERVLDPWRSIPWRFRVRSPAAPGAGER